MGGDRELTRSRDRGEWVTPQTENSGNSSMSVLFRNPEINAKNTLRLKGSPQEGGGKGRNTHPSSLSKPRGAIQYLQIQRCHTQNQLQHLKTTYSATFTHKHLAVTTWLPDQDRARSASLCSMRLCSAPSTIPSH